MIKSIKHFAEKSISIFEKLEERHKNRAAAPVDDSSAFATDPSMPLRRNFLITYPYGVYVLILGVRFIVFSCFF